MKKLSAILDRFTTVVALISFVGVAILVLLNVADVVATKIFVHSIPGAYEISELVLMCTVFASFAYGQSKKTHISMTLIIGRLPGRGKLVPYAVCCLISTVMGGLLTYAAFVQAGSQLASNAVTAILRIPYYPFYYVEGICMAIFTITLLFETIVTIGGFFNKECMELVTREWD